MRNTANTKKQARQNVAKMILERLEGIEISPYFGMSVWDMTTHLTYHLAQLKLTFKDIEEVSTDKRTRITLEFKCYC